MSNIKEKWVSREELDGLISGSGSSSSDIFASMVGGLTEGSIPFADASGFLTEDNAALFWDAAEDNLGIGTKVFGATMTQGIQIGTGLAPTANVADTFAFFSKDFAGGNACPHFRTENGTVIGLNQSLFTTDNVTFGTIGCGTITVANGSSINLQEDITFLGATTENKIKFPDALPDALSFMEGANPYMTFITTNGSETIQFHKKVHIGDGTPNSLLSVVNTGGDAEFTLDGLANSYFSFWVNGTEYWDVGPNMSGSDAFNFQILSTDGAVNQMMTFDQDTGDIHLDSINTTDAGDYDLRYDATNGVVYDTSDGRQKKNIESLDYGLSEILQLQPKSYTYYVGETRRDRKGKKKNIKITNKSKQSFGLIAQEVWDIIPEAVYKPEDETTAFWGLREKKLIPIMVNAIKELNQKIRTLEAQLNN